jgi:hypothetical protein
MINQKRIPFIPKLSREFKPMRHYLCETDQPESVYTSAGAAALPQRSGLHRLRRRHRLPVSL